MTGGKLRRATKGTEEVISGPGEQAQVCFAFDGGIDKRKVGQRDKDIFANSLVSCHQRQWRAFSFTCDVSQSYPKGKNSLGHSRPL